MSSGSGSGVTVSSEAARRVTRSVEPATSLALFLVHTTPSTRTRPSAHSSEKYERESGGSDAARAASTRAPSISSLTTITSSNSTMASS